MRRSYTKRRAALGLLGGPSLPPTVESRLRAISVLATAAADCSSKIDALKPDEDRPKAISLSVQRDQHLHEIHCLAVELGLADRQPERYGSHSVPLSTGGATLQLRREPRP